MQVRKRIMLDESQVHAIGVARQLGVIMKDDKLMFKPELVEQVFQPIIKDFSDFKKRT